MKKFFDDEGRVFGKINLIDLIAVLLLLGIALRALLPVVFNRPGPVHDAVLLPALSNVPVPTS